MKSPIIICLVLALLLSGCATRSFKDGRGVEFTSTVFMVKETLGLATIPTANGPATVKGLSSDNSEIGAAMLQALIAAAFSAGMQKQVELQRAAGMAPPASAQQPAER